MFLIRAPRRPASVNAWKRLPRDRFTHHKEPGRYVGAKAKEIDIAETTTVIKSIPRPVRTIVVRERAMKGKDRWHALLILHDDTTPALDLLHEYRTRQHHEQGHRIGVHDLWIDTSPSGYPKSGRPDRPGFRQGPLTLYAWIAALVWDALRALGDALPARFHLRPPAHAPPLGADARRRPDPHLVAPARRARLHQAPSLAPPPAPTLQRGGGRPAVARRAPRRDGLRRTVSAAVRRTACTAQSARSRF